MFGVSGKVGASTKSVRSSKNAEFGKECCRRRNLDPDTQFV